MKYKSIVYYIPFNEKQPVEKSVFSLECVLLHRIFRLLDMFKEDDYIGIKINSNENCANGHDYRYISLISKLLNKKNISSVLCDTSWKFKNRNTSASKHMRMMYQAGLSYENTKTPFVMLDGINGESEVCVEVDKKKLIYLAGEINNLSGMIFMSSAIRNKLIGFEGAMYNMGFGLSSKKGKIIQHCDTIPRCNSSRCYYCRKCMYECPVKAIYINDRHVEIDSNKCINCGRCVEIAKYGGIVYDWNATPDYFQEQIARYSQSVKNIFKRKMIFCNFIPKAPNIDNISFSGMLISKNPLAIDVATQEFLRPSIDLKPFFEIASRLNIGPQDYKLETVNY